MTAKEWRDYFQTLDGEALREKAIAANTASFVQSLQQEKLSAQEIHQVFIALAKRFKDTGQRPPSDGFYNLDTLIRNLPNCFSLEGRS